MAEVSSSRGSGVLRQQDSVLLKAGEKYTVKRGANSIGLSVTTDPLANK